MVNDRIDEAIGERVQKVNFSDERNSIPQFINFVKEDLGSGNHVISAVYGRTAFRKHMRGSIPGMQN